MNCISNDDIRIIDWIKSARVGATKIMLASTGYFAEHKHRNQVFYQPRDADADDFCKSITTNVSMLACDEFAVFIEPTGVSSLKVAAAIKTSS